MFKLWLKKENTSVIKILGAMSGKYQLHFGIASLMFLLGSYLIGRPFAGAGCLVFIFLLLQVEKWVLLPSGEKVTNGDILAIALLLLPALIFVFLISPY